MATVKPEKTFAPNPYTERGCAGSLDANSAGTKLAYANGRTVLIRDVKNPGLCDSYTEHTCQATVARFSPNGQYIASGDESGKIRMWAVTHPEKLLKKETPVLGGKILDLCWDDEGKRIVAGGDGGKSAHAKAFTAETGSALGEIAGPTKPVNSVAYRPKKPYRVATGSQDFKVSFFAGPPFKFSHSADHHTNFVQCVRYSADGALLCSVSTDKKISIYSGEEGELKGDLAGHDGGVYACAFNPSSSNELMTCSGDKTVKIWDITAQKCVTTFDLDGVSSKGANAMQVAGVYAGKVPIALSLCGDLTYLDTVSGKPGLIVQAHVGQVSCLSCDPAKEPSVFVGSIAGPSFAYTLGGAGKRLEGSGHPAAVNGICLAGKIGYSSGFDDCIRTFNTETMDYSGECNIGKQPGGVACATKDPGLAVTVTSAAVLLIRDGQVVCTEEVKYEPTCCAISADGTLVAVGGRSSKTVKIYNVAKDSLQDSGAELKGFQDAPNVMQFSPGTDFLAVGDRKKEVTLWSCGDWSVVIKDKWVFHQSSITGLAFSANGKFVVSGSVDSNIYIWNVASAMKKTKIALAHPFGIVAVAFSGPDSIVSVGGDNTIKTWNIKLPE